MSSGQIERDFGAASDVLTRKHGNTDPTYFQAQTTACVNFTCLPAPEEMPVTARVGKQWMQVYPKMVSVYPTYMLRRLTRTRMPTDCSSTVTETMEKKLVRTRV